MRSESTSAFGQPSETKLIFRAGSGSGAVLGMIVLRSVIVADIGGSGLGCEHRLSEPSLPRSSQVRKAGFIREGRVLDHHSHAIDCSDCTRAPKAAFLRAIFRLARRAQGNMTRRIFGFLLLLATSLMGARQVGADFIESQRIRVIDGDTITVDRKTVHLVGFVAPE